MAKVFMRVIARRLGRFTEDRILTEAQRGFKSHRRSSGQWLVLSGVCELRKREKKTSYLAFLDVSKEYDSMWRKGLWCKMRHYGVEEKFVKVCEELFNGVKTRVVMNRSQNSLVLRGV